MSTEEVFKSFIKGIEFLLLNLRNEIVMILFSLLVLAGKRITDKIKKKLPFAYHGYRYDLVNKELVQIILSLKANRAFVIEYRGGDFTLNNSKLTYSIVIEAVNRAKETSDLRQGIFIKDKYPDYIPTIIAGEYFLIQDTSMLKNELALASMEVYETKTLLIYPLRSFDNKIFHGLGIEFTDDLHLFTPNEIKQIEKIGRKIKFILYKG